MHPSIRPPDVVRSHWHVGLRQDNLTSVGVFNNDANHRPPTSGSAILINAFEHVFITSINAVNQDTVTQVELEAFTSHVSQRPERWISA